MLFIKVIVGRVFNRLLQPVMYRLQRI